jgi:hypothetical protein
MRALKILVIVMAVVILAGSATLIVVIAGRMSHSGPVASPAQPLAADPIELPAGARIETIGVGATAWCSRSSFLRATIGS